MLYALIIYVSGGLQVKHPSALDSFEQMIEAAHGKKIVVFLDYDGTLSPIVQDPNKAFMSDKVIFFYQVDFVYLTYMTTVLDSSIIKYDVKLLQMRSVVNEVANFFPTAIVSGRCLEKVNSANGFPQIPHKLHQLMLMATFIYSLLEIHVYICIFDGIGEWICATEECGLCWKPRDGYINSVRLFEL